MKNSRFTETQIVAILEQAEVGAKARLRGRLPWAPSPFYYTYIFGDFL